MISVWVWLTTNQGRYIHIYWLMGTIFHRKTGVVLWKLWANQATMYDTKWVISYVKLPEGTWDFRILDYITLWL